MVVRIALWLGLAAQPTFARDPHELTGTIRVSSHRLGLLVAMPPRTAMRLAEPHGKQVLDIARPGEFGEML
jgi:hypothetical protein